VSEGDGEDGETEHRIFARVGSLELTVKGQDAEWVSEEFDVKLDRLLAESEHMSTALRDGSRSHQ